MSDALSTRDILAIHEQIALYALLADERDPVGVGRLLAHADMYNEEKLVVSKDAAKVEAMFAATPWPPGAGRRHITTNIIVTPKEDGGAAATSYFLWMETLPDSPPRVIVHGLYRDRFAKLDGQWRFTERRIFSDGGAVPKASGG
jgi:hypothetical protein